MHKIWVLKKALYSLKKFQLGFGAPFANCKFRVFCGATRNENSAGFEFLILAPTGYAANAAQMDAASYADFDVVSVTPRSQDVKPYVMAIFRKDQQQRLAAAAFKKNALAAKDASQSR